MDSTEKDDATAQHVLVTPDRVEDKRIYLTPEEIMHRTAELTSQKMKSRINLSGLSTEEAHDLKDDGIGNDKRTQHVCNTKKFFAILMHSKDPTILKHSAIVKVKSGDDACFFHDRFKGEPGPEKRIT